MRDVLKTETKNIMLIALGLVFATLAYNMFLIPNDVTNGGFTGIAQLVNSGTGLPVGAISMVLNVPLFLISLKSLGLRFGLRSLGATIALSLLLDNVHLPVKITDMWLATVYGGLFCGLGFGLILRGSATTGGSDMLASLVHRVCPYVRVSWGIFAIDGLVIIASAFVFDMTRAMYGLICIMITNVVIDFVLEGPSSAHSFFIISDKSQEIAQRIMSELNRGVTGLEGTGLYSNTHKQVLLCVVSRMETIHLRRIVFSIDPKAFIVSNKAHDTYGEGFKELQ